MTDIDYESSDSSSCNEEEWKDQDLVAPVDCLFCNDGIDSLEFAVSHCKSLHGFDFGKIKEKFNMDCYSFIKLINFIRQTNSSPLDIMRLDSPSWNDDTYLKPVLECDPWLMFDFESHLDSVNEQNSGMNGLNLEEKQIFSPESELKRKCVQITELTNQVRKMQIFLRKIFADEEDTDAITRKNGLPADNSYFESYSHIGIHFDMLTDEIRTLSYKNAILCNESAFAEKTVLDVGCGTGILSMFAVSAGAKIVYAIDNSDIISYTFDIIRENKMEHTIDVRKARVEDVDLPVKQVDVIVSEWMGYFLLFEGMLDSVIFARNRYLKPGGLLLPDKCEMFLCGANDPEGLKNNSTFWSSVHGYRMTCIQKDKMKEAVVDVIPNSKIVTTRACIASFNLYSCNPEDTVFESRFEISAIQDTVLTTLVGYFDVSFNLGYTVQFSTSPSSPWTHWKQTLFHIYEPISLRKDETLNGVLRCEKNGVNNRSLKITINIRSKDYVYFLS